MFNQADAGKYILPAKANRKPTVIDQADEAVDIRDILKAMGFWTPDGAFYSYKINCPWAYEHADGGRDKNCRLFGSINFYCWAMHGFVTPTILYSRWKSLPRTKAAEILLEERGLTKKPWREQWNILLDQREASQHRRLGSKDDVIGALHTALASDSVYVEQEFHPQVRARWKLVLGFMDRMWENPDTSLAELQQFFDTSLTALKLAATMADNQEEYYE